jgi:hypothetical protein
MLAIGLLAGNIAWFIGWELSLIGGRTMIRILRRWRGNYITGPRCWDFRLGLWNRGGLPSFAKLHQHIRLKPPDGRAPKHQIGEFLRRDRPLGDTFLGDGHGILTIPRP